MGKRAQQRAAIDFTLHERRLWQCQLLHVAGLDEVGRGCLAGPVVAAAVILPPYCAIAGVDDSKKLTPTTRERLYEQILAAAIAHGVGSVSADEIDQINILEATRKAMLLAVGNLPIRPDHLLIDGPHGIACALPQTPIIGGDGLSLTIAAASIVAKVTRDRLMACYEVEYPVFHFARHKGYGTAQHLAELRAHGPTALHRCSFAPVAVVSTLTTQSPAVEISPSGDQVTPRDPL